MTRPFLILAAALTAAAPANAEFRLAPGPASPAPATASIDPPQVRPPARRRAPAAPVAVGFGEEVPLHVATRQILPEGVSVVFLENVDREALVNWQGGRPWDRVLADAIKPIGLKMVRSPDRVTISR